MNANKDDVKGASFKNGLKNLTGWSLNNSENGSPLKECICFRTTSVKAYTRLNSIKILFSKAKPTSLTAGLLCGVFWWLLPRVLSIMHVFTYSFTPWNVLCTPLGLLTFTAKASLFFATNSVSLNFKCDFLRDSTNITHLPTQVCNHWRERYGN